MYQNSIYIMFDQNYLQEQYMRLKKEYIVLYNEWIIRYI